MPQTYSVRTINVSANQNYFYLTLKSYIKVARSILVKAVYVEFFSILRLMLGGVTEGRREKEREGPGK